MPKQHTSEPVIDIVDQYNQPTGEVSTINHALKHGLWNRGGHVILYTLDAQFVVQQRSREAIQSPDLLTIGAGGYVDAGETPEQAAIREVEEETGIVIKPGDLEFLSLDRRSARWEYKGQQKINNSFTYNYAALIDARVKLRRQPQEVGKLMLLPLETVEQLLDRESPSELGRLVPQYRQYRRLLQLSLKALDWQTR